MHLKFYVLEKYPNLMFWSNENKFFSQHGYFCLHYIKQSVHIKQVLIESPHLSRGKCI